MKLFIAIIALAAAGAYASEAGGGPSGGEPADKQQPSNNAGVQGAPAQNAAFAELATKLGSLVEELKLKVSEYLEAKATVAGDTGATQQANADADDAEKNLTDATKDAAAAGEGQQANAAEVADDKAAIHKMVTEMESLIENMRSIMGAMSAAANMSPAEIATIIADAQAHLTAATAAVTSARGAIEYPVAAATTSDAAAGKKAALRKALKKATLLKKALKAALRKKAAFRKKAARNHFFAA